MRKAEMMMVLLMSATLMSLSVGAYADDGAGTGGGLTPAKDANKMLPIYAQKAVYSVGAVGGSNGIGGQVGLEAKRIYDGRCLKNRKIVKDDERDERECHREIPYGHGYSNLKLGAIGKWSGGLVPVGTIGLAGGEDWYGGGSAALLHSDGRYYQIGMAPVFGAHLLLMDEKNTLAIEPRVSYIHDTKNKTGMAGIGGQVFIDRQLSNNLRANALFQLSSVLGGEDTGDGLPSGAFYMIQTGASYKVGENTTVGASISITDRTSNFGGNDKNPVSGGDASVMGGINVAGAF